MNKAVAEIIGTFALVFAGTGAIVVNDVSGGTVSHVGIALTFGLIVMAMIYALGDISGAHLNPAVTFGFWLSKRLATKDVPLYLVSQFLGALLASGCLRALFWSHATLGATLPSGSHWQSFALETILSAMLMLVILCVANGSKESGVIAGVAIGGVVALEAMFAGPICGASMNPARSIAPAIFSGHFTELWIYIAGPMLGTALAAAVFPMLKLRALDSLNDYSADQPSQKS